MVSAKFCLLALVPLTVVAAPNKKRQEVAKPGVTGSAFDDISLYDFSSAYIAISDHSWATEGAALTSSYDWNTDIQSAGGTGSGPGGNNVAETSTTATGSSESAATGSSESSGGSGSSETLESTGSTSEAASAAGSSSALGIGGVAKPLAAIGAVMLLLSLL